VSVPSQEESNALYFSTHAIQSAMVGRDSASLGQRTDPTGGIARRPNLGAAAVSSGVRSGMYASHAELAKLVPAAAPSVAAPSVAGPSAAVSSGVRSGMYASHAELAKLVPQYSAEDSESRIYWDTDSLLRASSAGPTAIPAMGPMPPTAPTVPTDPSNAASAMPQARLGSSSDVMSDSFLKPVTSNIDSQENFINDNSRASSASKVVDPKYNHDSIMNIYRDALTKNTIPDYREHFSMSAPLGNMSNHSIDDDDEMYG